MTAPRNDYFRPGVHQRLRLWALQKECASWVGTPFRQRSCVKGPLGGVDCAGFVGAVFLAVGAIDLAISIPPYELNHADHSDESLLRGWFERSEVRARVRLLDEGEPALDGDMVFPKVGRTEHHLGIQVGGEIYHVVRPAGVVSQSLAGLAIHKVTLHRSRYRLLEA
jgi:cell wall-associated NlpC family hydrolase